jgi:hypothetical protein
MESLLLFRRALPSPTMCRFIPALSVPSMPTMFMTPSSLRITRNYAMRIKETFEPFRSNRPDITCATISLILAYLSQFAPIGRDRATAYLSRRSCGGMGMLSPYYVRTGL